MYRSPLGLNPSIAEAEMKTVGFKHGGRLHSPKRQVPVTFLISIWALCLGGARLKYQVPVLGGDSNDYREGRAGDKQKRNLQTASFDDQCFERNKQWREGVSRDKGL